MEPETLLRNAVPGWAGIPSAAWAILPRRPQPART